MATPSVRSVSSTTGTGSSLTIAKPAGVLAGDVLLCFHGADNDDLTQMAVSGGTGGWATLASRTGISGGWAGTRISSRTAVAGEPSSYAISQGSSADGVAVIVAIRNATTSGIVVTQTGGDFLDDAVQTPAATPPEAGCLDLRWAAGVIFASGAISWLVPSGYDPLFSGQSRGLYASGALVSRALASNAAVGVANFGTSPGFPDFWHGFTVLVPPGTGSGSGGPPPTPPDLPAFTPGLGDAPYQYFFRRLRDGVVLGRLDLSNVNFDKRILQPGTFNATIPIPNRSVAAQVAEIIPRDPAVLSAGPGVIVCDIFRDGVPWGEYWITYAKLTRGRRQTPTITLRGSTLDAYPLQVEIQNDLEYSGEDQVEIARQLLTHMQAQPYADISLVLQSGISGVARDRTYLASEGAMYGRRLQELAEVDDGFEHSINLVSVGGSLQRQWVWGYPKLGSSVVRHVFVDSPDGGDVLDLGEEWDALRGATRWRARGDTPASDTDASTVSTPLISTPHEATAHLVYGPRIDKTINRSGVTVQQTLEDYAAYWATHASGALRVESYTVALGAQPTLTPNSLGDMCRIFLNNEWHLPQARERRIIGIGITPVSKQGGKEECDLILEQQEVTS